MQDEEIQAGIEQLAAIEQLMRSDRGCRALKALSTWLDNYGTGLDQKNQEAVLSLLVAAWGPRSGSALSAIGDAVAGVRLTAPRKR